MAIDAGIEPTTRLGSGSLPRARRCGGKSEGRGLRQIPAAVEVLNRFIEAITAPLPQFDLKVVAHGDIVQPIGPVLAEPDLAVLALMAE